MTEGDHGYKLLSTVLDIEPDLSKYWLKSAFSTDCREALVGTETVPHGATEEAHGGNRPFLVGLTVK